jgi:hypothetical protein
VSCILRFSFPVVPSFGYAELPSTVIYGVYAAEWVGRLKVAGDRVGEPAYRHRHVGLVLFVSVLAF